MKEVFGGFEFGLTETCYPSLGSRHKYKLTMIQSEAALPLYWPLLCFFTTNMGRGPWAPSLDLPHILGSAVNCENSFDNLNIKP